MSHHYQQTLPQLLTIDKTNNSALKKTRKNSDQKYRPKTEQFKNNPSQLQQQANRQFLSKAQVSNERSKVVDDDKLRANKRSNQISKNLINEMMNKIASKTVSEDNYPISNETVQRLLFDLEKQIKVLELQLGKFQNSLLLNPSNQHLKKEKEAVEKDLNKLKTIKQLYNQKIEARNKISQLQVKIIELKNENKQLRIKIARGIQKIESHIHNLPCQRQKLLIEEVNKYKVSLDRQKEMRQNLEFNIQSIKLNCNRFYQQVEQARKIVYEQLQQIKKRECEIAAKEQKMRNHKCEVKTDNRSIKGENLLGASQIFVRKMTNKMSDQQNLAEIINQINLNQLEQGLKRTKTNNSKVPVSIPNKAKNKEGSNNNLAVNISDNGTKSKFNLQEQIERMRMNQSQFNKLTKKKAL